MPAAFITTITYHRPPDEDRPELNRVLESLPADDHARAVLNGENLMRKYLTNSFSDGEKTVTFDQQRFGAGAPTLTINIYAPEL